MASALNSSLLALENQYYIPFPLYCTVYSTYLHFMHTNFCCILLCIKAAATYLFILTLPTPKSQLHQSSSLPFILTHHTKVIGVSSIKAEASLYILTLLTQVMGVSLIKAAASLFILALHTPKSQLNQSRCLPFHMNSSYS